MKAVLHGAALASLVLFHIGCASDGGSATHTIPGNQMYDRQAAGQQRARDEQGKYTTANPTGLSYNSTSAGASSGKSTSPSPNVSGSSPSSGNSALTTTLSAVLVTAIAGKFLGPTIKSSASKLVASLKKDGSPSQQKKESNDKKGEADTPSPKVPKICDSTKSSSTETTRLEKDFQKILESRSGGKK